MNNFASSPIGIGMAVLIAMLLIVFVYNFVIFTILTFQMLNDNKKRIRELKKNK